MGRWGADGMDRWGADGMARWGADGSQSVEMCGNLLPESGASSAADSFTLFRKEGRLTASRRVRHRRAASVEPG